MLYNRIETIVIELLEFDCQPDIWIKIIPERNITNERTFIAKISFSIMKHSCMARTQMQAIKTNTKPMV